MSRIIDTLPQTLVDLVIRDYEAARKGGGTFKRTLCYDYRDLLNIKLTECYKLLKEIEERELYYRSLIALQESGDTPDFTDGELRVWITTKNILIEENDLRDMLERAKDKAISNAYQYGFVLTGWIEKLHQIGYELNERIDKDEMDGTNIWHAELIMKNKTYPLFDKHI